MGPSIGPRPRVHVGPRCPACGFHDCPPSCHYRQLTEYERKLFHTKCTDRECCGDVYANADDFFECTKCHIQWTTGAWYDDAPDREDHLDFIYDPRVGHDITVYRWPKKGRGDFPCLVTLEQLRQRHLEAIGWPNEDPRRGA